MTPLQRAPLVGPIGLVGLVAAALVAAAGLVGLTSASASAAVCSASGISAVVDYNAGAGGGIDTACNRVSGSQNAAAVFGHSGFALTRNPDGSVCKIDGLPAAATCGRLGNQYWALFWSNGKQASWTYSQLGVDGLEIPKNGSVAWAWQGGGGQRRPGVSPPVIKTAAVPSKAPQPTKRPTAKAKPTSAAKPTPSAKPAPAIRPSRPSGPKPTATTKPGAATATGTSLGTSPATSLGTSPATSPATSPGTSPPSAKSKATPGATATPSATASPEGGSITLEPSPSAAPAATTEANDAFVPETQHNGLPAWVPVAVIVLLAGGAGAAVWWRRRTGEV